MERLKIKESDRIESTLSMLKAFNVRAESDGKTITVYGGKITGGRVNSFNDHRIAMAGSVLGAVANGDTIIVDSQAVNKSYPSFYKDFEKVGGVAIEI